MGCQPGPNYGKPTTIERRIGRSRLVYDKTKRTIVTERKTTVLRRIACLVGLHDETDAHGYSAWCGYCQTWWNRH